MNITKTEEKTKQHEIFRVRYFDTFENFYLMLADLFDDKFHVFYF